MCQRVARNGLACTDFSKPLSKQTSGVIRPGRSGGFTFWNRGISQRQRWQSIQRNLHVQQLRVGVGRHRQRDVGVTHCGLSGSRSHAPFAQQRVERMSQSLNVDRPPAFVTLRDAGRNQVSVENADQCFRDSEQRRIERQSLARVALKRQSDSLAVRVAMLLRAR